MISFALNRYALSASAVALLAACGALRQAQDDTQPMARAPGAGAQSAMHSGQQSFHGRYLAKFTTVVGSGLPFSSLCLKFTTSGTWSSPNNGGLKGTYLISGTDLFASAIGYWSPPVYMTLQGSVNAKQGSGEYIVSQTTGVIFSGGTYTMTRMQNKNCSLGAATPR